MLASIGVQRCVLKVVPNWHGAYPLPQENGFVELLRSTLAAGSELALHGLEHRTHGRPRGTAAGRVRATLFANQAAEFMTLGGTEAKEAVREGLRLFAQAELPRPSSFCAPGWLLHEDARKAIKESGMRLLLGMFCADDFATGRRFWIPGFGYMGVSSGHEMAVQLLNWLVTTLAIRRATVAKVYLHPQGNLHSTALRATLDKVARMVSQGWKPATYAEVFDNE